MKVSFTKRMLSYLIDLSIVSIIVVIISLLFSFNAPDALVEESIDLSTKYLNQEITSQEFINQSGDLQYNLDYSTIPKTIANIVVVILIFVVYPFYNNGYTLGKKVMKLKIETKNDVTLDTYLIRSMFNAKLLFHILLLVSVMFFESKSYMIIYFTLNFIYMIILVISILMAMYQKEGLTIHDYVCKTKVVGDK